MRNTWQVVLGVAILLFGILMLLSTLTGIDFGAVFCPFILIALGALIIVRPYLVRSDIAVRQHLLGDIKLRGEWTVSDEEIWMLVGDVELDLTHAHIPAGETRFKVYGIVGEVELTVPANVGVSLRSTALLTSAHFLGQKRESFFGPLPLVFESPGFSEAERRVRLETSYLVAEVKVRQQ